MPTVNEMMLGKNFMSIWLLTAAALLMGCETDPGLQVTVHTSRGDIVVAVDTVAAPITSANFLRYVADRHYDGGQFFRVVRMDNQPNNEIKIEVIQGSANQEGNASFYNPIPLERTSVTGLHHTDGAISMARGGPDSGGPDSATHSFFFTIGDQPSLDFGGMRNEDGQGFAAFGYVLSGMEVILNIQAGKTSDERIQNLVEPVAIDSVRVN